MARNPEFRSGIFWFVSFSAILRMTHLAGIRSSRCEPFSTVRAPTTWSIEGSASRMPTSSGIRSLGYVMSASVHTTISPRAILDPMRRTVPAPPLRANSITRRCGYSMAALFSTSSVPSVDASSTARTSYV